MAHAIGVKILARAEEIADSELNSKNVASSEEKLKPSKSPVMQNNDESPHPDGFDNNNCDYSINYHKLIKSISSQEPRKSNTELLKRALRNRKMNAAK